MGDMIARSAGEHGWAGIIIHVAARDTVALSQKDVGVKALGSNPRKSGKQGTGAIDVPISFGGVRFTAGRWVYCDDDGIVVSETKLH